MQETVTPTQLTVFRAALLKIARANLAVARPDLPRPTANQAAREALQETHSALSQAAFFARLDACGGQAALVSWLSATLEAEAPAATLTTQYYISRERLTLTTDPATGDRIEEDFDSAGPFATAVEAQAYGEAQGWQHAIVRPSQPHFGMVRCPTCGLMIWPDDPHPEHDGGHIAHP